MVTSAVRRAAACTGVLRVAIRAADTNVSPNSAWIHTIVQSTRLDTSGLISLRAVFDWIGHL